MISDPESFTQLLSRILRNRSLNETLLNTSSSRSHCLFRLTIHLSYQSASSSQLFSIPLLIVDLAGSERAKRIDNYGQSPLMTEACNINKSLLVLGRCLKALAQPPTKPQDQAKQPPKPQDQLKKLQETPDLSPLRGGTMVIPYRDSKLTRVLFEYFNENSSMNMIVNINTNPSDYEETVRVLDYANLAKMIGPVKSVVGMKGTMVSERKGDPVAEERLAEKQRKIEMLEAIVGSLNDEIIVNNIMAKYQCVLEAFVRNQEILQRLEREDRERFRKEPELYRVRVVPGWSSGNSEKNKDFIRKDQEKPVFSRFLEEKSEKDKEKNSFGLFEIKEDLSHNEDEKSFRERNKENMQSLGNNEKNQVFEKKEFREIGLNTSPGLFLKPKFLENNNNSPKINGFLEKIEKNSIIKKKESLILEKINEKSEDYMEIPNIFNENSQVFNEKIENIQKSNKNSQKKIEKKGENEDFMIIENIFTNTNISLISLTKNSDSNENNTNPSNDSNKKSEKTQKSEKNEKKSEKKEENYENKENDGFLMNFNYNENNNNQEERKNKRKYRKKKKSHIKRDSPFKIEDIEMDQYKYAEIRKEDDITRQTPIIKRLRHRPTIKKHQCF